MFTGFTAPRTICSYNPLILVNAIFLISVTGVIRQHLNLLAANHGIAGIIFFRHIRFEQPVTRRTYLLQRSS